MAKKEDRFIEQRSIANIPKGYYFKEGTIDTGFVIENDEHDQYVYVPEGYNTEGIYVRGFWISRYEISKGAEGRPCSVENANPWVNVSYNDAKVIAHSVDAELISGAEYSRTCMWLVETKAASFERVYVGGDGNDSKTKKVNLAKTGADLEWVHNNIFDFGGNGYILTTEDSEISYRHKVARGGYGIDKNTGKAYPFAHRTWVAPNEKSEKVSFRLIIHEIDENED